MAKANPEQNLKETGNPGQNTNEATKAAEAKTPDAQQTINGLNEAAGTSEGPKAPDAGTKITEATPTVQEGPKDKPAPSPANSQGLEITMDFNSEGPESNKAIEGAAIKGVISHLESLGYTVTPQTEAQAVAEKTPEETEAALVSKYGEGYVSAERGKGESKETTYFTAQAWKNLDGDRGGWKKAVKTPPEVEALQAKAAS